MKLIIANNRVSQYGTRSIAPIPASQRLSPDILWYLYSFIIHSDGERGPTTVSHVSRVWRQTALQTTFLWTCVPVRLVLANQQHPQALSRLQRSKTWPIELVVRASRGWADGEIEKLVHKHAHRVRKLEVHAMGGCRTLIWRKLLGIRFPILEEFDGVGGVESRIRLCRNVVQKVEDTEGVEDGKDMQNAEAEEEDDSSSLVPFTPKYEVVLWGQWTPRHLTSLTMVLSGLHLSLAPALLHLYRILSLSTLTLRHFEFEGFLLHPPSVEEWESLPQIHLPVLASLKIAYYNNICSILDILFLPQLESLTLRNFVVCPQAKNRLGEQSPDPDLQLMSGEDLLQSISLWTTIKHLGIYGIEELPQDATFDYFTSLKNLESLVLYGEKGVNSIARSLRLGHCHSAPLLPKLKHLLYTMTSEASGLPVLLGGLFRNRSTHKMGKLKTLTLNQNYFISILELQEESALCSLEDAAERVYCIDDPNPKILPNIVERRILYNRELCELRWPRTNELV